MFIAFIVKLCIFNNFELMTFYHVHGPKSCNFDIDKNRFVVNNVKSINFVNLDQSTMGQLS